MKKLVSRRRFQDQFSTVRPQFIPQRKAGYKGKKKAERLQTCFPENQVWTKVFRESPGESQVFRDIVMLSWQCSVVGYGREEIMQVLGFEGDRWQSWVQGRDKVPLERFGWVSTQLCQRLRYRPRNGACHQASYLLNSRVSGPVLANRTPG